MKVKSRLERVDSAIGLIASMSSGLDDFSIEQIAPTSDQKKQWIAELNCAVSSLNRFCPELGIRPHEVFRLRAKKEDSPT